MRAGELRDRVTIQQKTTSSDSEGMVTETWHDIATVWATILPIRGREYFQAAAVQSETTTRIKMRYRVGVASGMQAVFGTQVFDIQSVIPDARRIQLELMCKEVI